MLTVCLDIDLGLFTIPSYNPSGSELRTWYFVFQIFLAVNAIILVGMFAAQIFNSRGYALEKVTSSNIKWRFHRMGFLASVLLLAYSVDPYGIQSLYTPLTANILKVNITCLMVACLFVLTWSFVVVTYTASFRAQPQWVAYLFIFTMLLLFVLGNATNIFASNSNLEWYTGIYILCLALCVIISGGVFIICNQWIIKQLEATNSGRHLVDKDRTASASSDENTSQDSQLRPRKSVSDSDRIQHMRNRTLGVLLLLLVVVPVWIYVGARRVGNKTKLYSQFHQDSLNFDELLFPVFLTACIWVCMWTAYIPFADPPPPESAAPSIDSAPPRKTVSSSIKRGSAANVESPEI